jgi:hypothetical protein
MALKPTRCIIHLPNRMHALASALGDAPAGAGVPEPLVITTVEAALRIAKDKATPSQVVSRQTAWLVREATKALAPNQWQLAMMLSFDALQQGRLALAIWAGSYRRRFR